MALVYAFTDENGVRRGKPDESPHGITDFPYVPASGPFADQTLTMHAQSREGEPGYASRNDGLFCDVRRRPIARYGPSPKCIRQMTGLV